MNQFTYLGSKMIAKAFIDDKIKGWIVKIHLRSFSIAYGMREVSNGTTKYGFIKRSF